MTSMCFAPEISEGSKDYIRNLTREHSDYIWAKNLAKFSLCPMYHSSLKECNSKIENTVKGNILEWLPDCGLASPLMAVSRSKGQESSSSSIQKAG